MVQSATMTTPKKEVADCGRHLSHVLKQNLETSAVLEVESRSQGDHPRVAAKDPTGLQKISR
jgi:hypothetical protein